MKIIFMCRANCFRSKVAETYFNKINKNKNIKVKSAGLIGGYAQNPRQIKIAKQFGLNIKSKPRGVNAKLLRWADILVIVADDVPKKIFWYEKKKKYLEKIINLEVRDVNSSKDTKDVKRAIKQLIKKVDKLNKQLERK